MAYKLSDIARAIDAELLGDGELEISSVASPEHASVHDIALAMDPKYVADLPKGKGTLCHVVAGCRLAGHGIAGGLGCTAPALCAVGAVGGG